MSLKEYSREELEVRSMLELSNEYLLEQQQAQNFNDLFNKVAELKGLTEEQKQEYIAQFYTDLTIDGRFLTISSGIWGLKRWYPVEQMDEIIHTAPKKKSKKKAKKKKEEEKPREEPEEPAESSLDDTGDNVEVLTDTFDDEVLDETQELGEGEGFDDEHDEADEDFDEEEEESEEEENEEKENK
ncbi:DNA-directed RNA polymerase subunit delta [Lentibacillus amyloliquefaciens]|uniref:Probable DNA-directed RNA polymerase subunit delta n=1 Tax=Lentibacillus amyloliquefaciens TaxID=1472767 RepID=A0A0U3NTD8_9BACI|nr:DNA-directed RNA polymerase subunit delta [Lentibacillus amyloliquefaciens]ALX49867.1 DNA-directed RNA polymerase subunit delta [Lentibacillus amyloliquefaciens]